MLVGRNSELKYLEHYYSQGGCRAVVVYGQGGVGKTSLCLSFANLKNTLYYQTVQVDASIQYRLMAKKLLLSEEESGSFESIMSGYYSTHTEEYNVLILDGFENLAKQDTNFVQEFDRFLKSFSGNLLVILVSSSIYYVENCMVDDFGKTITNIAGFLKLKELRFSDMQVLRPDLEKNELIKYYGILGGYPKYYNSVDYGMKVDDFVSTRLVNEEIGLLSYARSLLKEELRETSVYNAVMLCMAGGYDKLQQIHEKTGYSRAKILVYLKNLMSIGVVDKIFSFEEGNSRETKKAVYRICNPLLHFYYLQLISLNPSAYDSLYHKGYVEACREALAKSGGSVTSFLGKMGSIDLICKERGNRLIAANCIFDRPVQISDCEEILQTVKLGKIKADEVALFTGLEPEEQVVDYMEKNRLTIRTI